MNMDSVPSMTAQQTDRILKAGIGVLLLALVASIYGAIHQRVVVEGDTAPSFTLTADNGHTVSVPGFGGKLLVLNFWASWCPPCVEETPSLSQFAQQFASQGVVVLGVSVDEDEKAYRSFLSRFHPAFLTVREAKLHEEYGTFLYPETYVIDAQGRVLLKIAQGADFSDPALVQKMASFL